MAAQTGQRTLGDAPQRYLIFRIIPAMALPKPITLGPVTFCTTEHLAQYDLSEDPAYRSTLELAKNYHGILGEKIGRLGVMLVPEAQVQDLAPSDVPRMCRDAVSLCHVTEGIRLKSADAHFPVACASDYFDIIPVFVTDLKFSIRSAEFEMFGADVRRYRPTWPVHLPPAAPSSFQCDPVLLSGLGRAIERLLAGKSVRAIRQLFRAIAVAFHATRMLHEPDSSVHDLGTRMLQWISAFEVLVHPGSGRVGLPNVLALINGIAWPRRHVDGRARTGRPKLCLAHKRYSYSYRKGELIVRKSEGAASHFYRQLYDLRNALAHGNAVQLRQFRVFRRGSNWRVDVPAVLLFRECVLERMRQLRLLPRTSRGGQTMQRHHKAVAEVLRQRPFDRALARMLLRPRPD